MPLNLVWASQARLALLVIRGGVRVEWSLRMFSGRDKVSRLEMRAQVWFQSLTIRRWAFRIPDHSTLLKESTSCHLPGLLPPTCISEDLSSQNTIKKVDSQARKCGQSPRRILTKLGIVWILWTTPHNPNLMFKSPRKKSIASCSINERQKSHRALLSSENPKSMSGLLLI